MARIARNQRTARHRRNNSGRQIPLIQTDLRIMEVDRVECMRNRVFVLLPRRILLRRDGLKPDDGARLAHAALGGVELEFELLKPRLLFQEAVKPQQRCAARNFDPGPAGRIGRVDPGDVVRIVSARKEEMRVEAVAPARILATDLAARGSFLERRAERIDIELLRVVAGRIHAERAGLTGVGGAELGAEQLRKIRVPGAVDHPPGENRIKTVLAAERQPDTVRGRLRRADHRMVFDRHSGLFKLFVAEGREDDRIDLNLVPPMLVEIRVAEIRQRIAALLPGALHKLPADAGDDLLSPGVEDAGVGDSRGRDGSARDPVFFDQTDRSSRPRGLDRRADAGGSGPGDQDIEILF